MVTLKLLIILSSVVGSSQKNLQRADEQNETRYEPIDKRYSEATLASDHSKYMDTMRTKSFVDLLIGAKWPTYRSCSTLKKNLYPLSYRGDVEYFWGIMNLSYFGDQQVTGHMQKPITVLHGNQTGLRVQHVPPTQGNSHD
uniref:Glucagon / GIP / secretin / VIP family domain-containing protein n=1 Tax=Callorhinchus milii TaxID=7868 RepID=A0A4W3J5X3_CALMI